MKLTSLLLALGGALAVTGSAAAINPGRFIGLGDVAWLWYCLAAAGFWLLSVAGVRLSIAGRGTRRWMLASCAGCAALAGLASLALGGLRAWLQDYPSEQRVVTVSTDGRFVVVDYKSELYLQTTEGFFSKRDYLGCSEGNLDSMRFTDGNTIVVRVAGQVKRTFSFDPVRVRLNDTSMGDSCMRSLYTG